MSAAAGRRFLVTGANGCIGAWVVAELLAAGERVTTLDLSPHPRRLELVLEGPAPAALDQRVGDIGELEPLERLLEERALTHVVHLAALQVPFCRADPPLGARVNVLGTVNVLEAVARRGPGMAPVVYASSVAAFDEPLDGEAASLGGHPGTLYGVYKRANESSAWVYARERGVASVGLRPHTVYGVGRDQGLTSAPTSAMLAAAAGVPATIPYASAAQLQYARDVARAFVAASLSGAAGASVHNLPGRAVAMDELLDAIAAAAPASAGTIDVRPETLPFPAEVDASSFAALVPGFEPTPLREGVGETVARFRRLLERGLVEAPASA